MQPPPAPKPAVAYITLLLECRTSTTPPRPLAGGPPAGLDVPTASTCQTHPGDGVWAQVGERQVAVGRREWVLEQCSGHAGSSSADCSSSSSHAAYSGGSGGSDTEVWVGWPGQGLAGRLALSDALRPDAAAVVSLLRRRGLRVMLLSGDRQPAVEAMAAAAGIDPSDALAGIRPEGKAEVVSRLRREGRRVAMVGDGVNDAPALAR